AGGDQTAVAQDHEAVRLDVRCRLDRIEERLDPAGVHPLLGGCADGQRTGAHPVGLLGGYGRAIGTGARGKHHPSAALGGMSTAGPRRTPCLFSRFPKANPRFMVQIGYTMMTEQAGPRELVDHVMRAEEAGLDFSATSDHYFPWLRAQGHAPYAWSVLGA